MARIDWVLLCDLAFFDWHNRLCVIGITRKFELPHVPLVLGQAMMVAHLTDLRPIEEIEIAIAVASPSGLSATSPPRPGPGIQVFNEYILATLRDVALTEEGMYVFEMSLRGQAGVSLEIPVLTNRPAQRSGLQ